MDSSTAAEVRRWAGQVLEQLRLRSDPARDEYVFLAGANYRKYLAPHLRHVAVPLEGLRIGEQLSQLFRFGQDGFPSDGLYVLFEEGERGHGTDRIVRIGTHRGDGRLPLRLEEHFLKENKDRSIFRKNIGRALLARDGDEFLGQWEIDLTSHHRPGEAGVCRTPGDGVHPAELPVRGVPGPHR